MKIITEGICTGCTACKAVCPVRAISLGTNSMGFKYPIINESICIDCGKCYAVCPLNKPIVGNKILDAYSGRVNEIEIRKESSSGGIFSAIGLSVLDRGGVVYGAAFDNSLVVRHIRIDTKEDMHRLRMSKYVQSDIDNVFVIVKEDLEKEKEVLFSGTPCQVQGLLNFLGHNYSNLYTIDFVCHGVPSPKVFEMYKKEIEKKYKSKIERIQFRGKILGYKCSTMLIYLSNHRVLLSNRLVKSYMKLYFQGYISRESCYKCHFKVLNRVSDITLFDSFKGRREEMDDTYGVSNVFINTCNGQRLFTLIEDSILFEKNDIEKLFLNDGDMILESAYKNSLQEEFELNLEKKSYGKLIKIYTVYRINERILDIIKRIIVYTGLAHLKIIRKWISKVVK